MNKICLLFFLLFPLLTRAQELPNMKGQTLQEVLNYFDAHAYTYTRDTSLSEQATLVKVLTAVGYNADSTKAKLTLLKLKFDAKQVCYYSGYTVQSETTPKGLSVKTKAVVSPGETLERAGKTGILANSLVLAGGGLLLAGANSSNTSLTVFGSVLGLTGVILNIYSWNRLRKAGEAMK